MPKTDREHGFWKRPRKWLYGLNLETMAWVVFAAFITVVMTRYMGFTSVKLG